MSSFNSSKKESKWKKNFTLKLIGAIAFAVILLLLKSMGPELFDNILGYIKTDRYYKPVYQFIFNEEYIQYDNAAIVAPYGKVSLPGNSEYFHTGIDFDFISKADILSLTEGVVAETGKSKEYGKYIKITLSEEKSIIYGNLNNFYVKKGDLVQKDTVIADTLRYLHLELFIKGETVKPLKEYILVSGQ